MTRTRLAILFAILTSAASVWMLMHLAGAGLMPVPSPVALAPLLALAVFAWSFAAVSGEWGGVRVWAVLVPLSLLIWSVGVAAVQLGVAPAGQALALGIGAHLAVALGALLRAKGAQ